MSYQGRVVFALMICGAMCVPAWAQRAAPAPSGTSPIQKMIAVDQLVQDKQYDEAVREYDELLAADPDNAQILNRIGNTYQALQNPNEAKIYYERALHADPHFAVAMNNIGCLYFNENSYREAVRFYRKAIKMDPKVASFHSNLGFSYLAEKKYIKMMKSFQEAASLDPTIFDQHNRSGAIELERNVENRGAFYFYLAKTFGQLGDIDHCLEYLKKARDDHFKHIQTVKTDPAFAPVRPDPAIKEFIERLTA